VSLVPFTVPSALGVFILSVLLAGCGGGSASSPSSPSGSDTKSTLSAETGNNTSAANSFVLSSNGNAGAGNVSKLPIQSLLYTGSNTKVYAHLLGWFGSSGHISVGYQSNDAGQVHRQVADMMSRGIAGAILDWHGSSSNTINQTAMLLRKEAEAQNGNFQFAITEDVSSLSSFAASNHCDVTDQVITDLNYIAAQFGASSAYLEMNGRPVVFFFGVDTYYIDWNRVVASMANDPLLIFRGSSGLNHAQSNGAFQWEDHNSSNPFDMQLTAQDQFYTAAVANPSKVAVGSAYAGFNDTLAGWGTNRITDRDCGQTWLASLHEVSKFYSSSHQLAALQLVTWNDYDEGTAIESGIDNCVYLTPSISDTSLHWAIGGGNENTVDHYTVFISTDGLNLKSLGNVATGTHSFDLSSVSQISGTYTLYVKAVGKASFQNKMSPAIIYKQGDQSPTAALSISSASSLTMNASTGGSADSDGSIASSTIDFGDGTVLSGPHASHTYAAAGIYDIVAKVVDNAGASGVVVKRVSVKSTASGVKIFAPANGATVNWPTSFVATANMANAVVSMNVLVDGTSLYAVNSDVVNTGLKIFRGPHHITIQATDNTGATSSSSVDITAEPNDQAPIADVATFPLPSVGPNAVLACTVNSHDPDGFLSGAQVKFSDGATVKATGAVHTFAAPGTYSATATVTDQYGATDTATDTFSVP
jgi:hypothetical protein